MVDPFENVRPRFKPRIRPIVFNELSDSDGNVIYTCLDDFEAVRIFKFCLRLCPNGHFSLMQYFITHTGGKLYCCGDHFVTDPAYSLSAAYLPDYSIFHPKEFE